MKAENLKPRFQPLAWHTLEQDRLYSPKQVCKFLHVSPRRLKATKLGSVPYGKTGHRFRYTVFDIVEVAQIFHISKPFEKAREAGFLNQLDVQRICGLSKMTTSWWLNKGVIPQPSHPFPGCHHLFWSPEESEEIILFFKKRKESYQSWLASQRVYGWQQVEKIKQQKDN